MKDEYFKNGKPVHKLSYCAFLDVLGFSDRIRDSYKTGLGNELLQDFYKILKKRVSELTSQTSESSLYFKSFTDNIILAHPQYSSDMESEFGFILGSITEYQYEMAINGLFIRGGLSLGQLFFDQDCVYGDALLEAYGLEHEKAVNPIVVLSDNTMKIVDTHIDYYAKGWAPQVTSLFAGQDGRYFINYLDEAVVDGYVDTRGLSRHKEQVEKALHEFKTRPPVFSKYVWLAAYHNYFCDLISTCIGYDEKFKIDRQLAAITFTNIEK